MSEVHLLIPALSPPSEWAEAHRSVLRELRGLRWCIARSHAAPRAVPLEYENNLIELFDLPAGDDADAPAAAATHRVDFEADHAGVWMRADPVHLRADFGRLLLFGAGSFALSLDEARALTRELNTHLAAAGMQIVTGRAAERWYLRLDASPRVLTTPPERASGLTIDEFLPRGEHASRWQIAGNELQMLLHRSPVNAAREQRGELPVNSVWFWGAGSLPPACAGKWSVVVSDDPMALGLADLCGCPVRPAGAADVLRADGLCLVAFKWGAYAWNRGDTDGWLAALHRLDEEWLRPLVAALRGRRIQRLAIHCAEAIYTVGAADRWRFWRRSDGWFNPR